MIRKNFKKVVDEPKEKILYGQLSLIAKAEGQFLQKALTVNAFENFFFKFFEESLKKMLTEELKLFFMGVFPTRQKAEWEAEKTAVL